MSLKHKAVLGIPITISNSNDILEEILKGLKKQEKSTGYITTIFTPNPEIVAYALHDENFKEVVASAQINIPDGWGISWALRRLYDKNIQRLSGVDFMKNLCQKSEELGFRIGTIGGRAGVALKAKECLLAQFPRLEIEMVETGEIEVVVGKEGNRRIRLIREGKDDTDHYINAIVEQIIHTDIRILFVALGFPKQEFFIAAIRDRLSAIGHSTPIVLMAVGGSLDYISGTVPRAPLWLRERGGEWAYRLLREPSRFGRQLKGAEFFWRIFRNR